MVDWVWDRIWVKIVIAVCTDVSLDLDKWILQTIHVYLIGGRNINQETMLRINHIVVLRQIM